jgi:hypothetical protein
LDFHQTFPVTSDDWLPSEPIVVGCLLTLHGVEAIPRFNSARGISNAKFSAEPEIATGAVASIEYEQAVPSRGNQVRQELIGVLEPDCDEDADRTGQSPLDAASLGLRRTLGSRDTLVVLPAQVDLQA